MKRLKIRLTKIEKNKWYTVKKNFINFFNYMLNDNTDKRIVKFKNLQIENDNIDFEFDMFYFNTIFVMEIHIKYSYNLSNNTMLIESITDINELY